MKKTNYFTRICAFLSMCAVFLSFTCSAVYAQTTTDTFDHAVQTGNSVSFSAGIDYNAYLGDCTYTLGNQTVSLLVDEVSISKDKLMSYTITVPENGLYEFTLSYVCLAMEDIVLSLYIDGTLPFSEADALEFPMYWINDPKDKGKCDKQGNEFAPGQILYDGVASSVARNYTGSQEHPYRFALSAGEHTVELQVKKGLCLLKAATFTIPEDSANYTVPSATQVDVAPIVIEGESAELKNDRTLIPLSNQSSVKLSPCNPTVSKLNYIGGSNSRAPGSELTWSFHVEQAGYKTAYSDYSEEQYMLKGQVAAQTQSIVQMMQQGGHPVLLSAANSYIAGLSDGIVDAPLFNGGYDALDVSVPFYELVYRGYIPLYSEPMNLVVNSRDLLLSAVEAGVSPSFTLAKDSNASLADSVTIDFYGISYDGHKELLSNTVGELTNYLSAIGSAKIQSHQILQNKLTKTVFDNGVQVFVNHSDEDISHNEMTVKAKSFQFIKS